MGFNVETQRLDLDLALYGDALIDDGELSKATDDVLESIRKPAA